MLAHRGRDLLSQLTVSEMRTPQGAVRGTASCGSAEGLALLPHVDPPFASFRAGQVLVIVPSWFTPTAAEAGASGNGARAGLPCSTEVHGSSRIQSVLADPAGHFRAPAIRHSEWGGVDEPPPHPFSLVDQLIDRLSRSRTPSRIFSHYKGTVNCSDASPPAVPDHQQAVAALPTQELGGSTPCSVALDEKKPPPPQSVSDFLECHWNRAGRRARLRGNLSRPGGDSQVRERAALDNECQCTESLYVRPATPDVQAAVVVGPSGGGKTFVRTHAVSYAIWRLLVTGRERVLSRLTENGQTGSDSYRPETAKRQVTRPTPEKEDVLVFARLVAINVLMRAFLHAKTEDNASSTRCCTCVELRVRSKPVREQVFRAPCAYSEPIQIRVYPLALAGCHLSGSRKEPFHIFELLETAETSSVERRAGTAVAAQAAAAASLLTKEVRSLDWLQCQPHATILRGSPKEKGDFLEELQARLQGLGAVDLLKWALDTVGVSDQERRAMFSLLRFIECCGQLTFQDQASTDKVSEPSLGETLYELPQEPQKFDDDPECCRVSLRATP